MPVLLYMPYFMSAGHGVAESQAESRAFFEKLPASLPNVEFRLDVRTTATDEDRLPYFRSIWGQYDIIQIESTKTPTFGQICRLIQCGAGLICSQNYETNIFANGEILKFPAHKDVWPAPLGIKQGCGMHLPDGHNLNLKYCSDADDFCDVSDLGIIKISRAFQKVFKPEFLFDKTGYSYNDVERWHQWLFTTGIRWHRHKDLAHRNELFHVKNAAHCSEYLTLEEYKQWAKGRVF